MEEVAALLKQARETKGVSLKEVETITHIPMRYLEILEGGGDARFLSDRLYLIPFLRNYAAFLDTSPETIVAQFIHETQRIEASAVHFERLHEPSRFSPWIVLLSLLVVSLTIIFFVWHRGGINFLRPLSSDLPSSASTESFSPSSPPSDLPSSPPSSTPFGGIRAGNL